MGENGLARGRVRGQLVAEAARAFVERGYAGTSLASVAAAVGVSRQAVGWHFSSKEALLLAVLEQYEHEETDFLQEVFLRAGQDLVAVLVESERRARDHRNLQYLRAVLAGESLHPSHPAHTWFRERDRRNIHQLAAGIRVDQEAGRLHPKINADLIAPALLALLEGMPLLWLRDEAMINVSALEYAVQAMLPPP